jgi:dynein heavy chain
LQYHYDYGMRAVKTVIATAGQLRLLHATEAEDAIVLMAIRSVNLPKFLSHDLQLFEGILSDLFPGVELRATPYPGLNEALISTAEKLKLQV